MSFDSFGDYATIVVFGASGDLAKKKTFPALFGLFREKQLPSTVQIIGYARSHLEDEEFKQRISEHFKGGDEKTKTEFLKLVSYISGPYDTD